MRRLLAALCLLSTPAAAQEAPNVVVDIAPINVLVAQMMEGAGTPLQIIPTGASPHSYAMRPSEARALRNADLVIWVGPALTHWLEEPLDTLAGNAARLTLMDQRGTMTLPMRDVLEMGHDAAHSDDHGENRHEAEGHEQDEHAENGHEGHAHEGGIDPHGWLAPANAVHWAAVIAQTLSEIDPQNAETYAANQSDFSEEMSALEQELRAQLAPYRDTPFIVLHDAFHYFETAFDIEADAFIVPGNGQTPGPAQIKALRDHLTANPAVCAFTSPQENDGLLRTVIEGQGTHIAVLDPMGDGSTPFATMLRRFADDMVACLSKG